MKRRKRVGRKPKAPEPTPNTELWRLAELYLEHMAVTNYAEKTIQNRRAYLRYFFDWLAERGIDDPREVTQIVIERYQRHLFHYRQQREDKPLSTREQHGRLTALRGYFKFLARKHHMLYNPAAEIDMPKLPKKLPRNVLTVSEAEQVLAVPDLAMPLGFRDRVILEVLYSTGIRRAELINLSIYDVDHERGTVFINKGKGNKDRVVPIGDRALRWLDKYLFEIRPKLVVEPDPSVLFLTEMGESISCWHLTALVRKIIKASGINKAGSCHLFRHTMATLMLENGADIRFVQEMLGHARLDTTQVYTQVSIKKLKDIHTSTHPAKDEPRRKRKKKSDQADDVDEDRTPDDATEEDEDEPDSDAADNNS